MTDTNPLVLIVDDDEEFPEVLNVALKGMGYDFHCEASAVKAQAWLLEHHQGVCLIISDIMMPDGNGLDFCRWLKSQPALANIPMILCTGLSDDATMQDALELGVVDFIRKPVPIAVIREKIERFRRRPAA